MAEPQGIGPDVRVAEDQDPVAAPKVVQRMEQVVDLLAPPPGFPRKQKPDLVMSRTFQQGPDHRYGSVGPVVGDQEQLPVRVLQIQKRGKVPVQARVQPPAGNDQRQRGRVRSRHRFRRPAEHPQKPEASPQRKKTFQQREQGQEDEPVRRWHVQSSGEVCRDSTCRTSPATAATRYRTRA